MAILDAVDALFPRAVVLRRKLHAHPELSLNEHATARFVRDELADIGLDSAPVGQTGVVASIKGRGPGKVVALRADIDALPIQDLKTVPYASQTPGVAHVCGHDAHTAGLLTAARALKAHAGEFDGEIRLFFQQAEEIGGGAPIFIREGHLAGVDVIFGLHGSSQMPVGAAAAIAGATNASCDKFTIHVAGRGGHASTPHLTVDALYIASQIVVQLQGIASRFTAPLDPVVVSVGKLVSGDGYNIVAANALLEGTTRSFSHETRKKVNDLVTRIATDIGTLYGAAVTVEFEDFASPLVNHPAPTALAQAVLSNLFGAENVRTEGQKSLGADDFAQYLLHVPGVYVQLGTADPGRPETQLPLHHAGFDIDERAIANYAKAYIAFALRALAD